MNWSIFLTADSSASLDFLETAAIAYAIARSSYRQEVIWGSIVGLTGVALAAIVFAILSLILSIVLVVVLHRYLLSVSDVFIKLGVGILLSMLGTCWLGEGAGLEWWFGEWTIMAIAVLYSFFTTVAISWLKAYQLSDQALEETAGH